MSTPRGACPTLHEPMLTGDGLLVRLSPAGTGWRPAELSVLAEAAARFGSGMLEVTSRGNLQIRGLTSDSAAELAVDVEAASIPLRTGLAIDTGPLAGIDADEIADPLPLARDLKQAVEAAGLFARLAPKTSIVIDGGGALSMDDIIADVRLTADSERRGDWHVAVGGTARTARPLESVAEADAVSTVLALLEAIAANGKYARGRDLRDADLVGFVPKTPFVATARASTPVGRFPLNDARLATSFALPFGQVDADTLAAFCAAVAESGAAEIRLAPGRGLIVPGLDMAACSALESKAAALGFITDSDDPRLVIAACAGAPFCASAHFATRALGAEIARAAPELLAGRTLHISGCAKRCAEPPAPDLTILGADGGCLVLPGDGRTARPTNPVAPEEALAAVRRLADTELAHEEPAARNPQPAEI
ncbi:precorrin-3B synthase [Chelativorans sp. ZYF759]|uniref:precorrin-3B synthase n=1 Tax=Chelativorans sp. ZYF759 TaxID=2692213 RepID=UPI00145EAC44|nr:precorrin-3B synthase [Chelativorans sp. ZYF759]NMG38453.1 precorrin-3B synthase [Chelativorans sp. ZYF759]